MTKDPVREGRGGVKKTDCVRIEFPFSRKI